jgi:hypothetical protein
MVYHLQNKTLPDLVYPQDFRSLGKVFEKAVDLLGFMDPGAELFICNEQDTPLYSIKFLGRSKFNISELNQC